MAKDLNIRVHFATAKKPGHFPVFVYVDGNREPLRLGYTGNGIMGRPDEAVAAIAKLIGDSYTEYIRSEKKRLRGEFRVRAQDVLDTDILVVDGIVVDGNHRLSALNDVLGETGE